MINDGQKKGGRILQSVPPVIGRGAGLQTCFFPQDFGLVGLFPGELRLVATEVPVDGGLSEDRPAELEMVDDAARGQGEVFPHELIQILDGHLFRVFRVDQHRDGIGHADRIGELHFALFG